MPSPLPADDDNDDEADPANVWDEETLASDRTEKELRLARMKKPAARPPSPALSAEEEQEKEEEGEEVNLVVLCQTVVWIPMSRR